MIVIFDVEGVLIDGEFLPEIAKAVGKEKKVREITDQGIAGDINWEQGLRQRMDLIRGVTFSQCLEVSNKLPFMKGAFAMAEALRKLGCIMVGVSGGFSLLGNRVRTALGFDHVFSNELVFHNDRLIGYGLLVNANKAQILDTAFGDMLTGMKKVAVVDGANDLDLFDLVDLKIAFNAQRVVKDAADIVIEDKDLRRTVKAIKSNAKLLQ